MRLKLGRPNLADYAGFFDAPPAQEASPLTVTWAGVTTLLIDDGDSALMTDGFFSRPSLAEVGLRTIVAVGSAHRRLPRAARGAIGSKRYCRSTPISTTRWTPRWSPSAPARKVVGGTSAAQVGRGHGLPDDRLVVVTPGRAPDPRGIRRHADRVRTLPTRPLSRA